MPKQKTTAKKVKSRPSTQSYLDIAEIRDDTVVLKDGTVRAVLMVTSINFALKSEEEQQAVIQGYISFLNSLDFSVQIVIQSRKLVIDDYLSELKKREKQQPNELLRMQIAEYRQYIQELVSLGDIMQKRFYVVVPYSPATDKEKGFLFRLKDVFAPTEVLRLKEEKFQEYKEALNRRVEKVIGGLASLGLSAVPLDTQGLIELYYNTYNPDVSAQQKLVEVERLRVE